ncbi:MAG: peroxide stress protein YaaA [Microbacterium enclense]
MLVLLPPSETKRPGGTGTPFDLAALGFPSLSPQRLAVVDALVALSGDEETAARVLKLSPRRRHEIDDNAVLRGAPTLPAIDRYTGVLFDALDSASLDAQARAWLGAHVAVHSAPFGPVGALDGIPAYRLAASTSLPGLPALRRVWSAAVTSALSEAAPDFVLDLRSEAYAALGPIPDGVESAYVRVVTGGGDAPVRALNHFNKRTKGELVRALAVTRPTIVSREDLLAWASGAGWPVLETGSGEIALFS